MLTNSTASGPYPLKYYQFDEWDCDRPSESASVLCCSDGCIDGSFEPGAPRFRAILFAAFGGVALVIAMVGLFALTSFDVTSRRRELGVRIALGASRRAVLRLVLLDSAKPVMAGLVAGLGLAVWSAPFLQSFLYRMSARDPWTLAVAAVALLAASLAAAWAPTWRATRIDPVEVLRQT